MKKYLILMIVLFVFTVQGFGAISASAYDSGCLPGYSFSATTGQSCSIGSNSYVTVYSIFPTYGSVGQSVTITGSGFTPAGNTINFGGGYLNGYYSSNGNTITFTIPSSLTACPPPVFGSNAVTACSMMARLVTNGNYNVSVINANGTSNSISFSVTGSSGFPIAPIPNPQPVILNCTIKNTLRIGSSGSDVSCLQEHLNLTVDSKFGPITRAAVISFQSRVGLAPDGIVGPKSIAVLVQ